MDLVIVGLGRLGSILHTKFSSQGLKVGGTYARTPKGLPGEVQWVFDGKALPSELRQAKSVIFCLTPSTIADQNLFMQFCTHLKTVEKFFFVSSTSVYGQGEVNEESSVDPQTSSAQLLVECEKWVLHQFSQAKVIRPAGLYSDQIHSGRFMSGKTRTIHPDECVNLIDINTLADHTVKLWDSGPLVLNSVNKHHPKKAIYYNEFCFKQALAPIEFNFDRNLSQGKLVDSLYPDFLVSEQLP